MSGFKRRDLLWVDGLGGLAVGVLVLLLHKWLIPLYGLPRDLVFLMIFANLGYGAYSSSLATRKVRPRPLILLLIAANLFWGALCLRWAFLYFESASIFGLAQLILEGLYVAGLGCVEWRWREDL